MPKIHKLAYHEAQKIAAGEVVERPANVVKELIENALDAGATAINLFIEDGGKKLIRIVDNGSGMEPDDAHLCFEHHATSKITTVDDLSTLTTFGFRGEALSSIASVSHVTLITNTHSDNVGIQMIREGNVLIKEQPCAAPRGTDFTIRDIFYNVPARLKFLKKRETEFNQIHALFQAYSLAYPHLHWTFSSEGSMLHNCPPTEQVKQRLAQLFDQRLVQSALDCSYTSKDGDITISGIITDNTYARYDRTDIFFFVNNRWIKNQALSRALLKGYAQTLPPGRFPAACLFISMNQEDVDINVHPRKEEVLFLHPKTIENALYALVTETLEKGVQQTLQKTIPQQSYLSHPVVEKEFEQIPLPKTSFTTTSQEPLFFGSSPKPKEPFTTFSESIHEEVSFLTQQPEETALSFVQQQTTTPLTLSEKAHHHSIIGYLQKTYILLEHEDGLYLVDQHAAHERIIYERLASSFEAAATVQLLFPHIIRLSEEHINKLEPHYALLHSLGIEIEPLSQTELVIKATPVHAQTVNYDELVRTLIGWLYEYDHLQHQEVARLIHEKLRAQIACKAAVKAGDELTREQMEQLLKDLVKTPNRFSCPHGRPTGWLLSSYEIEKRFRRKQ